MKKIQNIIGSLIKMLFFLLMIGSQPAIAQIVHTDSIEIHKVWKDKNGENKLTVNVNALCNPDKPPFDGHKTKLRALLKNKNFAQEIIFDDKNYQMEMILFREKDIWLTEYKGNKAVFIPFFYCGNADNDVKVSFIIFYNRKKYLYHIKFYCNEEGKCNLNEPNINLKLKGLPKEVRDEFAKKLKAFTKASQFGA
ncbi:hypothetical protein [Pedobacter sp.]|uniref:hypothetical protein n=1 Tax=Pedobacter sp. TaxID=1411316 RepID=UPI0031E42B01